MKAMKQCLQLEGTLEDTMLFILPYLLSLFPIDHSEGTKNTALLTAFFHVHHLFLWAVEKYPALAEKVDSKIEVSSNFTQP
jgi:hypothetical protein